MYPPDKAIQAAVRAANRSPCAKSKRGVVLYRPAVAGGYRILSASFNSPPEPFRCKGDATCRASCSKVCGHAEAGALLSCREPITAAVSMLHVKTVEGVLVPSGGPSCWQCSRLILQAGVPWMWLYQKAGWVRYSADIFHRLTLRACKLPE